MSDVGTSLILVGMGALTVFLVSWKTGGSKSQPGNTGLLPMDPPRLSLLPEGGNLFPRTGSNVIDWLTTVTTDTSLRW